jgi:hypothetical protein
VCADASTSTPACERRHALESLGRAAAGAGAWAAAKEASGEIRGRWVPFRSHFPAPCSARRAAARARAECEPCAGAPLRSGASPSTARFRTAEVEKVRGSGPRAAVRQGRQGCGASKYLAGGGAEQARALAACVARTGAPGRCPRARGPRARGSDIESGHGTQLGMHARAPQAVFRWPHLPISALSAHAGRHARAGAPRS